MEFQEKYIEEVTRHLFKYCLKMTGSFWIADDLVQETLIKVIKMKRDEPQRQMSLPFLYTIAKNRYIDELRKEQKYSSMIGDLYIEHHDFREWDELLQIFCSSLSVKQAMLIVLKDVFQYSSQEIAEMLRVSDESIKIALHRARKKLKSINPMNIKTNKSSNESSIEKDFKDAIKNDNPFEIFQLYRLIESKNHALNWNTQSEKKVLFVSDPDGNMLEVNGKKNSNISIQMEY